MKTDCSFDKAVDFERILELPACASDVLLRDHFRARSWELHPDVCFLPDAAQRFGELRTAYESALVSDFVPRIDSGIWDDPQALKVRYASTGSGRARSGLVRRIAQLESWNSLPFLYQVLAQRDYPGMWAAVHAFIRLEVRSAAPRLEVCYGTMPRGLRCAVIRYARTVDPECRTGLGRIVAKDSDPWIAGCSKTIWAGELCGVGQ